MRAAISRILRRVGFVPGLRNDVFISYSHADNETGWVAAFHDALVAELGQTLPTAAAVARDKDRHDNEAIRAGEDIPSKLQEDLYNSALLVCVVSPRYLSSEYCRKERDWFARSARQREDVSRTARVIKIIKRSDAENLHQQLMADSKECDFRDPASTEGRIEWPIDSPEFRRRVTQLAIDIEAHLRQMKAKLPGVYIAPCQHERENGIRERLEEQLKRDQFNVFPGVEINSDFGDAAIQRELGRPECVLSVHLFGNDYDADAVRHAEIARRLQKPVYVWADIDPADCDGASGQLMATRCGFAEYRQLVTYRDRQAANPAEFVHEVREIATRLANKGKRTGAHLYLICDRARPVERDAAESIGAFIRTVNATLNVVMPPDSDVGEHYERLRTSRAVILYRGNTPADWFTGHYADICRQARKQPALRSGVFLQTPAILPPVTPPVPEDRLLHDNEDVDRFVRDL